MWHRSLPYLVIYAHLTLARAGSPLCRSSEGKESHRSGTRLPQRDDQVRDVAAAHEFPAESGFGLANQSSVASQHWSVPFAMLVLLLCGWQVSKQAQLAPGLHTER